MKGQETGKETGRILYLVIPCYNEEQVLPGTADELRAVMVSMTEAGVISPASRILFVDDGSRDGTWQWLKGRAQADPMIAALSLCHNAGHQNALYAGLMAAKEHCDLTVSLDCDLQDDPALIPAMVGQFLAGNDIVYAVRSRRREDSWFKKGTAFLFYRLMKLLGTETPADCGDFRLLSRRALEYLARYPEERPFLRGLVPLLGLPSATVYFDRRPRQAGKSKYSVGRMVRFALDGICSMSLRPLSFLFFLGGLLFGGAGIWLLFHSLQPAGPGTVIATIWAACGLLLIGMGILGQYIGRIWQAQLGRPRFLIRETWNIEQLKEEGNYAAEKENG